MLSQKLISTIKLHKLPAYEIAHKAGLHPSTLSKLLNGIEKVHPNDSRILKVGEVLGLNTDECFWENPKK